MCVYQKEQNQVENWQCPYNEPLTDILAHIEYEIAKLPTINHFSAIFLERT